mgnify:CR=1 FL=1
MANSYIDVNYTSPSTTLAFTNNDLKYLELAHIKLVVSNNASGATVTFLQTDSTTFTISEDSGTTTINYAACVSSFPAGANQIRVQRVTPSDNLLTTFTNSSLLRAEDLNENADQLLYVLQEQLDQGTGSLPLLPTGQYDASDRQLINVKDATDASHVTTLGQISALVSNSENAPSVAQNWEFNLGATGSGGTFDGTHTSFTLTPNPASAINATFIVEVAGVIQRPDSDFQINGNILKVLDQNLTTATFNGTTIVAQNFGLARTVFNFPVTGEATNASEVPITLKGFSGGDATEMLKLKDSANNENASISAGGTVKAKVIEPITSGTLAVNPTTLTTTGAIVSNGNLSVGDGFSVTETTGDTTVNKLVISSTDTANFASNMAVPKDYVDSSGGFAGVGLGVNTHLNSQMTPGNYRGNTPSGGTNYGYPAELTDGLSFALIVRRTGGTDSNAVHQELIYRGPSQKELRFERIHSANAQVGEESTEWGDWKKVMNSGSSLNDLGTANGNYSMGTQRIINHGDPVDAGDVVNKSWTETSIRDRYLSIAGILVEVTPVHYYWDPPTFYNQQTSTQTLTKNGVFHFWFDPAGTDHPVGTNDPDNNNNFMKWFGPLAEPKTALVGSGSVGDDITFLSKTPSVNACDPELFASLPLASDIGSMSFGSGSSLQVTDGLPNHAGFVMGSSKMFIRAKNLEDHPSIQTIKNPSADNYSSRMAPDGWNQFGPAPNAYTGVFGGSAPGNTNAWILKRFFFYLRVN